MILVPYLPFRRAAESLETNDLQVNIVGIKDELGKGRWDDITLSEYGLTSLRVLGNRGFHSNLYYKVFRDIYRGIPVEPPLWVRDFFVNHRKHLVLLGWLRYFTDRGATHLWCAQNHLEHPLDIVKRNPKPLKEFKALASRLTEFKLFERSRQYHQFIEEPEVTQLSP